MNAQRAAPPSVIAFPLADARHHLTRAGWRVVVVTETHAPNRRGPTEPPRVVRQTLTAGGVALVVTAPARRMWEHPRAGDGD